MDGKVESWLVPFFPLNSKFFIEILSPGSTRFFANFKMTVRLQQSQEPLGSDSLPKGLTDLSDPSTYVDVETVELILQAQDQKTELISVTFTVEGVVTDGFVCNAAGTEIMINDTIEIDFVTGMKVDNMTEIKRDDGLDCGFQSQSQVGTVLQVKAFPTLNTRSTSSAELLIMRVFWPTSGWKSNALTSAVILVLSRHRRFIC